MPCCISRMWQGFFRNTPIAKQRIHISKLDRTADDMPDDMPDKTPDKTFFHHFKAPPYQEVPYLNAKANKMTANYFVYYLLLHIFAFNPKNNTNEQQTEKILPFGRRDTYTLV